MPTAAPALKDLLPPALLPQIAQAAAAVSPGFASQAFAEQALAGWSGLSVMERMRRIAQALAQHLPGDAARVNDLLCALAPRLPRGFVGMALAECALLRGQHDCATALDGLERLTPYGTAEFAIRPLLARHPAEVLARALAWTGHADAHVRRLASEGLRPRLPWGQRLDFLGQQPELARPVLERLRSDPSDYVRRSVANHLNDLAKTQAAWVLDLLAGWPLDVPATRWIARHALRNLVKAGDARALALLGVSAQAEVQASLQLQPAALRVGGDLALQASLTAPATAGEQALVVDFAVGFVKQSGAVGRKVFKWRSFTLAPGVPVVLDKRLRLADLSTRKHHPGRHAVELLVNGQVLARAAFELQR